KVIRGEAATHLWARLTRGANFALAAFMALQELGIATATLPMGFTVALAARAVSGALAFVLGNGELAGRVTRDWYERRTGPRYRRYAPASREREPEERDYDEQGGVLDPRH